MNDTPLLDRRRDCIEAMARAAHEVNRAYCIALGDISHVSWDQAPDWQKNSARNGVLGILAGNTPEQSHESWLAEKTATGWKYGPQKNPETKEHPCMLPYSELPREQRLTKRCGPWRACSTSPSKPISLDAGYERTAHTWPIATNPWRTSNSRSS